MPVLQRENWDGPKGWLQVLQALAETASACKTMFQFGVHRFQFEKDNPSREEIEIDALLVLACS
jgi:hypothetical protein